MTRRNGRRLTKNKIQTQKNSSKGKSDSLVRFLHKSVKVPPHYKSILPGNDFYRRVNGYWLHHTSIPPHRSSYSVSEEVEDGVNKMLFRILHKCKDRVENNSGTPSELAIGRLALSALTERNQQINVDILKKSLRAFLCIQSTSDVARMLGELNRMKIPTILSMTIESRSAKQPFVINLSPGSLGLPDSSYYVASAPGKSKALYAYTKLLLRVSGALDLDPYYNAVPIESAISAALLNVNKKDIEDGQSLKDEFMKYRELCKKFPSIPWDALFNAYGVSEDMMRTHEFGVDSVLWLSYLETMFKTLPFASWSLLLSLHIIVFALPFLPPPFDDWHSECFERVLRGQRKKTPQTQLALNVVKKRMPALLGSLFVKEYISPSFKKVATDFVEHIRETAALRMSQVQWFSKATQAKAAKKIRAIQTCVAYSEDLGKLDFFPEISTESLLGNILFIQSKTTNAELHRIERAPPKGFWQEAPYAVNAYFYQETNQLILPAANFFWPFYSFSPERLGWNYGGIGAIIGHEITHAFDGNGKEYDEFGEEKSWWTAHDEKEYSKRTDALVKLFSKQTFKGYHVNGRNTINENIADLGGLGIALDALQRTMAEKGFSETEQKKEYRDFFCSYAVSWRTKEKVQRHLQDLILDAHAPPEFRVNLIVSQFDEWYTAFDIEPRNSLYIPPEERIRIF